MENLHTEYADEVGLKYGMERGDSIKETGAVHRTTEEYRRKLWKDAQEKEEEVRENIKTIEQQNSTITNQRGIIASLSREIKHSAARLKALATMIKNLETHKADLEQEIKKLNRDLAAGKISKEEADRKLSQINAEIKKTEEKIIDKADKLKVAESKLHDAEQRKAELEAKAHEAEEKRSSEEQKTALAVEKTAKAEGKYQVIKAKYKEIAPKVNLKISHEFGSLGFHMAALDMKSRLSKYGELRNSLSPSQRDFLDRTVGEIFDGSLIENVAENSANLCSVAASLYLGYLNAATRIAQSCGGGGGPGTGWGKRDDENDMDFRRRCFGMAMKMMKPGRQQRLKR
jgi:DNA repair exonuclease SbcCD ATPase subunit